MKISSNLIKKILFGLIVYTLLPFMSVGALDFGLIQCKYTTKYMSKEAASYKTFDFEVVYSDYKASDSIGDSDTYGELGLYRLYHDVTYENQEIIGTTQFLSNSYDTSNYGNVGIFANINNMWADSKDYISDERASRSFKSALKEINDCPKYFYLKEKSSGGSKTVEPIFTNKKPEICDSSFDSNEPCHIMLEGNSTFKKIIDEEQSWAYDVYCTKRKPGDYIGASIDIHSKGNVLRYNSFNKTTSDYLPADDITDGLVHDVNINSIYLLEKNMPFKIAYNPREKNSKKSWVDGICFQDADGYISCGDDYCYLEQAFSPHYNCTTYDDIKSEIEAKEAEKLDAINSIKAKRNLYLECKIQPNNLSNCKFVVHNREYYMTRDIDYLLNLNNKFKDATDDINKKTNILSEYLNYIRNKKTEMCKKFVNELDGYSNDINIKFGEANAIVTEFKVQISYIKDALIELGATKDQLDSVDLTVEDISKLEEKTYQLVELSRENILTNQDFGLGKLGYEGCGSNGLLSADMKKVLNLILWYIRIIGVVLAIVLSILDYIKVAAGSDDKSLSAANKKFVTRMILVAVLFLLPVLLETVLGLYNPTTAESIKCLTK